MTIIDLEEEKVKRSPHLTGKAHCIACGYKWIAIAPIGTTWLECPECKSMKGLFDYHIEFEGLHWQCSCENELFYIMPDGCYCPNCGVKQTGF